MDTQVSKGRIKRAARKAERMKLCVGITAVATGLVTVFAVSGAPIAALLFTACIVIFWITKALFS